MKRAPLANIVLPIAVGIIFASWISLPLWSLLLILLILLVALIFVTFHTQSKVYYLVYYPFWIFLGAILLTLHNPLRHQDHYSHFIHRNAQISATIVEPPQSSRNTQKIVVEVNAIDSTFTTGRMMLFVEHSPKSDTLFYGDHLTMIATAQLPSAQSNPYQFNYRRYLQHRNIFYQAYLPSDRYIVTAGNSQGIKSYAISLRQDFINIVQRLNLSNSQKGIVEAIFLGWDNDLSLVDRQQFRDAGLAHLLCVSGLHVGIIAGIIGMLLFFLGRGPRMRILKGFLQLIGVWLFAMLTGLAPATTRASIMFSLFIIGHMFQLQQNSYNTLSASALILLITNPQLIFNIGFQLSYSAVFGIITLVNPMYRLIHWKDRALLEAELDLLPFSQRLFKMLPIQLSQKLWKLFCLTTIAQLSVLPITLFYFHQFPTYFLIANLTIVPLAGVLLLTIMCSILFSHWSFPTLLLSGELNIIDSLTQWISQLPYASLTHIYFDVPMLLMSIAILFSIIFYFRYRKGWFIFIPIGVLISMLLYVRIQQSHFAQQHFWIIYDAGRHSAIEFYEGNYSTLLADSAVVNNPQLIDYQSNNLHTMTMTQRNHLINIDTCHHFQFGSNNLYIVDSTNQWSISSAHPTHLILTGNPHLTIIHLAQRIQFDTLIFTTNNSFYHLNQWSRECDSLSIPYHNMALNASFTHFQP